MSLSLMAALLFAIIGIAGYVRHLATERSLVRSASDAITLRQAELLLQSDPTAAFELLRGYQGDDRNRAAMLRAQARGLGLPHLKANPHTQNIYGMEVLADGAIVTIGADETIAKTSATGATRIIATGVILQSASAYTRARHLMAYACHSTVLCILDLDNEHPITPSPNTAIPDPVSMTFSPSGALLASVSAHGELSIFQISGSGSFSEQAHAQVTGAETLDFVDDNTLVAGFPAQVAIFDLDGPRRTITARREFSIPGANAVSTNEALHLAAVSTNAGNLVVIDTQKNEIVQRATLCKSSLLRVSLLPSRASIGYACQDGTVGTWDTTRASAEVVAQIDSGAVILTASSDDRYLLVGSNSGVVLSYDFSTRMQHLHAGHMTRITALTAASPVHPYLVSADATGEFRVWPAPDATMSVAIQTNMQIYKSVVLANNGPMIAVGGGPSIPWRASNGTSGELVGHRMLHNRITRSLQASQVSLYGGDDEIEQWSLEGAPTKRTAKTSHGVVTSAVYMHDGEYFISGSRDGVIEAWSPDLVTHRELGSIHEAVVLMMAFQRTERVMIVGAGGTLWLADRHHLEYFGTQPGALVSGAVSPDARWLALAEPGGAVSLRDISTRQPLELPRLGAWIDSLAFSPDSSELAITTDSKVFLLHVADMSPGETLRTPEEMERRSRTLEIAVRWIAYSDDGQWLAMISDRGGIWFSHRADKRWVYLAVNKAKLTSAMFTSDSKQFVTADRSGKVLVIDLGASVFTDAP